MHPMERLRSVARAAGVGPGLLVPEAAEALARLDGDAAALVTACRRLVDRHPDVGPMWWLASRVLCAADPVAEAWRAAAELESDASGVAVAAAVPDDATVVVVGWPDVVADGLRRRGDVTTLVVSGGGESGGLVRRLVGAGAEAEDVPDAGLGGAVASAGLVLLEASAAGPERFAGVAGSLAAAAVGRTAGVPVWLVAGVGRALPAALWTALEARLERSSAPPWHRGTEVVPLALVDRVIGPAGPRPPDAAGPADGCPVAPELLKLPV